MSIKRKKYIEKLNEIVSQKGGQCLSCIYKGNDIPLEWECKRGHVWAMKPYYIKDGSWCKECKKIDILDGMKKYAQSRGGKCLSKEFISSKTKMLWQCNSGHTWESNTAKYNKSWCPYCAKSVFLSESKCRFIFEKITGYEFKTNRSILGGLELDGHCADLNIAFEYNGSQHFKYIKHFHRNANSFNQRQERDLKKVKLCEEMRIDLLVIPHWVNSNDSNLLRFIQDWLKKKVVILPWDDEYWDVFYRSFVDILANLQNMASQKNGKLLSDQYYGASIPLQWQCSQGHIWGNSPAGIQQGHWCPKCNAEAISKRNRNAISDVQNLAKKNNSILVSCEYKNNVSPLEWKCNQCLNIWDSTLNAMKTRLLKGKWCLFCKKKRRKNASKQTKNTKCSTQEANYCS